MKRTIIYILLIAFSGSGYAEPICKRVIPDDYARKIALLFLEQENVLEEYANKAESTIENECVWLIAFKHKNWKARKPSSGVVSVHKTTGEAKWMPSR